MIANAAVSGAIACAFSRSVVRRAIGYGVVVGALLIAINHGDAILRGDIDLARVIQMGLTTLVPYAVSTLSSVQAMRATARVDRDTIETDV